jgi:hypothetical protein
VFQFFVQNKSARQDQTAARRRSCSTRGRFDNEDYFSVTSRINLRFGALRLPSDFLLYLFLTSPTRVVGM